MVNTGTQLTLEEFLALPDSDIYYEFINSQAVAKVSPKYFHSTLQIALGLLIRIWCKGKGRVVPEWAILLKRHGKDWAPLPDITYISYERLPKSWRKNEACPASPELVIEIICPDQTMKEFEEKAQDYLAAGVLRVWVIDPEKISIRVFFPDGSDQVYTANTPIIDVLFPGLELTTQQIFEEADLI
jgi:Uma2 family endonuclease